MAVTLDAARSDTPVFVDPTGRRVGRARRLLVAAFLAASIFLIALTAATVVVGRPHGCPPAPGTAAAAAIETGCRP